MVLLLEKQRIFIDVSNIIQCQQMELQSSHACRNLIPVLCHKVINQFFCNSASLHYCSKMTETDLSMLIFCNFLKKDGKTGSFICWRFSFSILYSIKSSS